MSESRRFRQRRGLLAGLGLAELPQVVGAALAGQPDLGDGGHVQDVVQSSVPGPVVPVPDVLAGGSVQGCGAGPRREVVAVREPGDVADIGQDSGGSRGSDAAQVQQVRPTRLRSDGELLGQRFELGVGSHQVVPFPPPPSAGVSYLPGIWAARWPAAVWPWSRSPENRRNSVRGGSKMFELSAALETEKFRR
jgi:hypothetical protein